MNLIYCCVFAVAISVISAERMDINDGSPIRFVETSFGKFNHKRIDFIDAIIEPRHVTNNGRVNFPNYGDIERYYQEAMAPGDERGHLVGSQFSGPPQYYNLSPQNARVNRNAGFRSITTDWYGTECEVRRFLDQGGLRQVLWQVTMSYVGESNRPDTYRLQVEFFNNGQIARGGIDTTINNPFLSEDSTFWMCTECGAESHEENDGIPIHDELRRRRQANAQCTREC